MAEAEQTPLVTETEDGGVVVDFDPNKPAPQAAHDGNLAEDMDATTLGTIGSELLRLYETDRQSRADWEKTLVDGMDLMGMKNEERTEPWNGACGVIHPVLGEAIIRFQSQAITEIFPADGPVKTKVAGQISPERQAQAGRVQDYMNYLCTEEMVEYRGETERLLYSLPFAGSAFRKVYFDPDLARIVSSFVPAEDVVVAYGESDVTTAERLTHVMRRSDNWVKKMQVGGFYCNCELTPPAPKIDEVKDKKDKMAGRRITVEYDDRRELLEMHVVYDLPGYEHTDDTGEVTGIKLPYIITIDRADAKVLSIRRNWREGEEYNKGEFFIHFQYLPGDGFYGYGLVHLIGGLAKSATSLLRQLVDAGTLANLPGGLKAKGLRIKGESTPIKPGEFRDVDILGGAIKDNLAFLPYKEPSEVLYRLLSDIVEEARRFASIADLKISDMNAEAPVGTTLAIIERTMKVQTAVHARLHHAMRREFKLIADLIGQFGPDEYPYEVEKGVSPKMDFDRRVDILPVSDPNASTMAQRIMQHQAALQLAAMAPEVYRHKDVLHRRMLDALGIPDADEILPVEKEMTPTDPATENLALLKMEPVKAHLHQDHEAHIKAHMAMAQDPKILGLMEKSPNAPAVQAMLAAHVQEHIGMQLRREQERVMGVPLPGPDQPLPPDVEVNLSSAIAEAAERVLGKHQQEEQAKKNREAQEDPVVQMQREELAIKKAKQESDARIAEMEARLEERRAAINAALEKERIDSNERIKGAELGVKVAIETQRAEDEGKRRSESNKLEGMKLGTKIAESIDKGKRDDRKQLGKD